MKFDTSINSKNMAILPYLGFALIVFSVKLIIIANYGNATPFWDQWDAEADHLYRPLLEGNLIWANLFAPHNEHRILTTRLLAIALFYLNGGVWNPILQMQVNAGIHVFALTLLLFYTTKALTSISRNALLVFCTIVFSIPFGWENTLAGFQSQFYFLLLFNFIFLWAMVAYTTYNTQWWLGLAAGLLCPLSLASGAFTLLAGSLVLIIKRVFSENKKDVSILSIASLLIMASIFIILTPNLAHHVPLKAHSLLQFFNALITILSWPDTKFGIGLIIIHIPILLLIFAILCRADLRIAPNYFIAAITLWIFGQFAAIAYGRAIGNMSSRYLDLFAIGLVMNFAAIAILFEQVNSKQKLFFAGFSGFWIATIIFGFAASIEQIDQDLKSKFHQGLNQEKNVRAYLCSGDFSYLQNKARLDIPYPNPMRLKSLLDNPTIRGILPGNIYGPNSNHPITFCNQVEKSLNSLKISDAKTCIGSIDTINGSTLPKQFSISDSLDVSGWLTLSPTQTLPPAEPAIVVLTDNKGKNLFFKTQKQNRPDVATHFNNPALSSSGFTATINVASMSGSYTLGLGFIEGETIKLCPQFKIQGTINKQ